MLDFNLVFVVIFHIQESQHYRVGEPEIVWVVAILDNGILGLCFLIVIISQFNAAVVNIYIIIQYTCGVIVDNFFIVFCLL